MLEDVNAGFHAAVLNRKGMSVGGSACKTVRQPGIEPGAIAWKATMLTFTPPTLDGWASRW